MQAASEHPALSQVFTTFNVNVPSYEAKIDRQKAMSYGVPMESLNSTLGNTFGNGFVNYFSYQGAISRSTCRTKTSSARRRMISPTSMFGVAMVSGSRFPNS